jgi:hypothetical protein
MSASIASPPSTNGKPSTICPKPQDKRSDSWGSTAGRGSPDLAPAPDRRSPVPSSTADHPSTNGCGARQPSPSDDFGRFDPGNPLAPGNRFARLVAELRLAAVEAVPREKLRAIFVKMSDLAVEGNVQAAKFVAAYLIGKPKPALNPDRSDLEEWQQFKEEAPMMREVLQHGKTTDPIVPLTCARGLRHVTTRDQGGILGAAMGLPETKLERLFELGAAKPHEVCNLLRDKARNPSPNGKRKHRR